MALAAFSLLRYQGAYGISPRELADIGEELKVRGQGIGYYKASYAKVTEIIKEYSNLDGAVEIANDGSINNFAKLVWQSELGFSTLSFLTDSENEVNKTFVANFFYGFAKEVYEVAVSHGGRYPTLIDFLAMCAIGQMEGKGFVAGVRGNFFEHYNRFRNLDIIPDFLAGDFDHWNEFIGSGYPLGAILRDPKTSKRCIFGKLKAKDIPWAGYSTDLLSLSGEQFFNGDKGKGIGTTDSSSYLDITNLPRKVANYSALVKTFIGDGNIATFTNNVDVLDQRTNKIYTVAMCGAGDMSMKVSIYPDILSNPNHADDYIEVLKVLEYNPVKIIEDWPLEDMFDLDFSTPIDLSNLASGTLSAGGTDRSPFLVWLNNQTQAFRIPAIWNLIDNYFNYMSDDYYYHLNGNEGDFIWKAEDFDGSPFVPQPFFLNKNRGQIQEGFKAELMKVVKEANEVLKSSMMELAPNPIPLLKGQKYYLYIEYKNGCLGTTEYGLPSQAIFMPIVMWSMPEARFPKYIDGIKI